MGEYFMASLVLQFPCQRQEILPRWRLFGAQIAPLQEDNARFLEEKWWTSDKKKTRVFPVVLQLNFPLG